MDLKKAQSEPDNYRVRYSLLTCAMAAAQITLQIETRGEIQWSNLKNFRSDPVEIRIVRSDLPVFFLNIILLHAFSMLMVNYLYRKIVKIVKIVKNILSRPCQYG